MKSLDKLGKFYLVHFDKQMEQKPIFEFGIVLDQLFKFRF